MLNTDNEKDLSSQKYDAKLFNQVYRASLRAKEVKKEDSKNKKKIVIYACIGFVLLLISSFLIFRPKPREDYVLSIESSIYTRFDTSDISSPKEIFPVSSSDLVLGVSDIDISADSAIAFDFDTGQNFFEKNIDEQMPIASLTKLVTTMVMIDKYGLDYQLEITKDIPKDIEWTLGLEKGDVISTDQLLRAMLISSYNDAAYVVANEYGFDEFIALMNQKVKDLGCENTHFENPMGYDSKNHYSTVSDLKKIVNVVLKYPSILEITKLKGGSIEWISQGSRKDDYVYTTNKLLLDNPNVIGLKTGYTEDSGQCLVTLYEEGESSKYVVILLNSQDRFGEAERILNLIILCF